MSTTAQLAVRENSAKPYSFCQRVKTAYTAINRWRNPFDAVALEGIRRGGTPQQLRKWRMRLVRKGFFKHAFSDVQIIEHVNPRNVYREDVLIDRPDQSMQMSLAKTTVKNAGGQIRRYNMATYFGSVGIIIAGILSPIALAGILSVCGANPATSIFIVHMVWPFTVASSIFTAVNRIDSRAYDRSYVRRKITTRINGLLGSGVVADDSAQRFLEDETEKLAY